jgi:hypothetical protein
LSKIGAEAAQHALRCVGVVNLPIFPESRADKTPPPAKPGISGTCALSMVSAFATRRLRFGSAVTMATAPFAACADGGLDIASELPTSSIPSAIGFQMADFRRKLFSQEARREPPVLFDTAGLSGLYPFATAGAHRGNGFQRCVFARPVGAR